MRAALPHRRQVQTTLPPVRRTLEVTPGSSGTPHPLQNRKSRGIRVLVLRQILTAMSTYLLALPSLPERAASWDSRFSTETRSAPILAASSPDIRRLDICHSLVRGYRPLL